MKVNEMALGGRQRGTYLDPFVVAEIGVNHEGDFERAKRMVSAVAQSGGDAAKFQTYKAESLAVRDSPAYWDRLEEPATSQYELFQRHDSFGEPEYRALADHCHSLGIEFMSTPFDLAAVEMLEPLVNIFKVASADITNVPLLRRIGAARKPTFLSTGAATEEEIREGWPFLDQAARLPCASSTAC